jgi:hypothetical protein
MLRTSCGYRCDDIRQLTILRAHQPQGDVARLAAFAGLAHEDAAVRATCRTLMTALPMNHGRCVGQRSLAILCQNKRHFFLNACLILKRFS